MSKYLGLTLESNKCGKYKVLEAQERGRFLIEFLVTGTRKSVSYSSINSGNIKDPNAKNIYGVACIGDGDFKSRVNGSYVKSYRVWKSMIRRCYSPVQESYIGVTVCDEWLNYQNFAEWYSNQENSGVAGYDLDKDIKKPGNRVYCPEACSLVKAHENRIHPQYRKMTTVMVTNETGEVFTVKNRRKFARENGIEHNGFNKVCNGTKSEFRGWRLCNANN